MLEGEEIMFGELVMMYRGKEIMHKEGEIS